MIEFEILSTKKRLYKYKGRKLTLDQLSKLPECTIKKSTLSARISNAIKADRGNFNTKWTSIELCVTCTIKEGFSRKVTRKKAKKVVTNKKDFIGIMNSMPVFR